MLKSSIIAFAVLLAVSFPTYGASKQAKQSITSFLSLDTTDRIVVAYAPRADFAADDAHRFEIKSAKAVKVWLKTLSQIPAVGPGIRAKLRGDAPEYRIDFMKREKRLGQLRMKAGKLDSPGGNGWDFYKGEDRAFAKMVEKAHQRTKKESPKPID